MAKNENNVYITGSWKNREAIKYLMGDIEKLGNKIAVDWTEHKGKENVKNYAQEIIKGLQECDCFIYCMDGIKSIGKNFELGFAAGLNKPIAIYLLNNKNINNENDSDGSKCLNLFGPNMDTTPFDKMIEKECIFIQAKMYPILRTFDKLITWLSNIVKIEITPVVPVVQVVQVTPVVQPTLETSTVQETSVLEIK